MGKCLLLLFGLIVGLASLPAQQVRTLTIYESLGSAAEGEPKGELSQRFEYDSLGHLLSFSAPSWYCTETNKYDELGRILHSEHYCGETITNGEDFYTYKGNEVFVEINAAGFNKNTHQKRNAQGLPVWEKSIYHDLTGNDEACSWQELALWEYEDGKLMRHTSEVANFHEPGQAKYRAGEDTTFGARAQEWVYEYDAAGREIREVHVSDQYVDTKTTAYSTEGYGILSQTVIHQEENPRWNSRKEVTYTYNEAGQPALISTLLTSDGLEVREDTLFFYTAGALARKEVHKTYHHGGSSEIISILHYRDGRISRIQMLGAYPTEERYEYTFW
jgi:hypothetical protein